MSIKKIIMIEPRSPGKHIYSRYPLPRLGLPILGTIAKRRGCDVSVVIEELSPIDMAKVRGADLLCLSTITSTALSAYRLADEARACGVTVVMGGPHVTFMPDEALQHADYVIRGEAEHSFPLFLDLLDGIGSPEDIPGLSFYLDGQVRHNPLDKKPLVLDEVPIPDMSLLTGMENRQFYRGMIPMATSRGCPHHCKFCSVTPIFGHQMRFASHERVAEELEGYRGKGDWVFFYDDNFCGSPTRTKNLIDYLLTKQVFLPQWSAQVSVRAAKDEEMLALMQRSGCKTVFVGFESINNESLNLLHKRQAVDDIRLAVQRFHKYGMHIHGMFILGADTDTVETIRETARFICKERIDSVQLLILVPLPGTPVFQEMEAEERLLTRDWSLYDAHHAVFRSKNMSPYALMDETFKAMSKVYSFRRGLGYLVRGKLRALAINRYGALQVRRWRKDNYELLEEMLRNSLTSSQFDPAMAGS
jgi:radical SAM superfamily enzyme YgiQ (UPF0313 family)